MSRILAVGSVALDSVETPFGKVREALGGSATFFSAAARLFAPVSVVAVVGTDFPTRHLRLLRRLGVDTSGIQVVPGRTFRWKGRYGEDLNSAQTLRTDLNVFQTFRPEIRPEHRSPAFLFLANIDPVLQLSVLNQVRRPRLVACDTMNYWIENKRADLLKLLRRVDLFLCNDAEAKALSGRKQLREAARWILERGPDTVVVKKGEHGVVCHAGNWTFQTGAYPVEAIQDPTGAGDSFAGGFVGTLARTGRIDAPSLRRAVVNGTVVASFNVESFSLDRLAALKPSQVADRLRKFRRIVSF